MSLRRFLPVASVIMVLLSLTAVFHFRNQGTLSGDDTQQFELAQTLYYKWISGGLTSMLKASYWEHAWRPTLPPLFGVLPLFLTHGRTLPAVALTTGFSYLVFLIGIASLLLEFLPPLESAVATVVIGTLPWVFFESLYFYSEIYLGAFGAWFALFVLKSHSLRDKKMCWLAGAAFGLAVCCRPVEGVIDIGFPVLAYLAIKRREFRMEVRDWLWLFLSVLGSAVVPLLAMRAELDSYFHWLPYYVLFQIGIAAAYFAFRKRATPRPYLFEVMGPAQWLPVFWFAPGVGNLRSWIWTSHYVTMPYWATIITESKKLFPVGAYAIYVLNDIGGKVVAILLVIASCAVAKAAMHASSRRKWISSRLLFLALTSVGPLFMGIIQSQSGTWDVRYLFAALLAWTWTLLSLALAPELPWRRFRVIAVIALAGMQVFYIGERVTSRQYQTFALDSFFRGPTDSLSPWPDPEPARKILRSIADATHATENAPVQITILLNWSNDSRDDLNWAHFMNVLSRDERLPLSFRSLFVEFPDLNSELKGQENFQSKYFLIQNNSSSRSPSDLTTSRIALAILETLKFDHTPAPRPLSVIPWTSKDGKSSQLFLFEAQPVLKFLKS